MDCKAVAAAICDWLQKSVKSAGCNGIVFGLSGGLDSAVVAGLGMRALPNGCLGVIMPCHSDPQDVEDAEAVARSFGLPTITCDLGPVYDKHLASLQKLLAPYVADRGTHPVFETDSKIQMAEANLKPRLRMTALYYYANILGYLVVGTTNRSELTVGYFTKHGDGGSDLLPLGELVKTHVRELAEYLGVPRSIIDKPPTAGLWEGQTDEGEMGISYPELDRYILTGEAPDRVRERVEALNRSAQHKFVRPPIAPIDLS
jgi:NAD+ synthase